MALTTADADRMIAARDRSGCMLSVFHNRRWDWDYLTVKEAPQQGMIGRPLLFESSVCRYAPPRGWRGHVRPRRNDLARLGRTSGRSGASARTGPMPPTHGLAIARPVGRRR